MVVMDTAIAAGTQDKGGTLLQACLQDEVSGHTAGMQTCPYIKLAMEVVQVALKNFVEIFGFTLAIYYNF